jgi:hypothetical protein
MIPLGRPKFRWGDNIRMNLQKVECGLAQDKDRWQAIVNAVLNLRVT